MNLLRRFPMPIRPRVYRQAVHSAAGALLIGVGACSSDAKLAPAADVQGPVPAPPPTPALPQAPCPPTCGEVVGASGGMSLRLMHPGTFEMGRSYGDPERDADERAHSVTISRAYYLGTTEVTRGVWEALMGTTPWVRAGDEPGGPSEPASGVHWYEAVAFANALSAHEGLDAAYTVAGKSVVWDLSASGYRLPTEAEWEFAARGGTRTAYPGTDKVFELCKYANIADASARRSYSDWLVSECDDQFARVAPVGSFLPNTFGFYDMAGNAFEWVYDWYAPYPRTPSTIDPAGPESGDARVIRGGAFNFVAPGVRVANRDAASPKVHTEDLGFRVARFAPAPTDAGSPGASPTPVPGRN